MLAVDVISFPVRAAAILTNAYVGALLSSVIPSPNRVQDYNQLVVFVDFTLGSLTDAQIKFEFNPVGSADLYQEANEVASVGSNIDTRSVNLVVHKLSISGKYRFAFPLAEGDVKISIIGTGTLTSSTAKISASLGKTFA